MPHEFVLYLGILTLRSLGLIAFAGMLTIFIRSVAVRHAIWAVTVGSILLLPAADALLPAIFLPEQVQVFQPALPAPLVPAATSPAAAISRPAPVITLTAPSGYDWWQWAFIVYCSVVVWLLSGIWIAYRRLRRLTRTSVRIQTPVFDEMIRTIQLERRAPLLVESDLVRVPLTVGFLKPVVFLPQSWTAWKEWDLRAVLAHELTHVRRADWAITAMAGLNRALFWFNPLSWWLERHLRALAEQASDEASLSWIGDAPRYAEVLLGFAAEAQDGRRLAGGMAMARGNIRARIDRILSLQQPQSGVLKRAGWIGIVTLALPVMYVAAAVQNAPPRATPPAPARTQLLSPPRELPPLEPAPQQNSRPSPKPAEPQNPEPRNLIDVFNAAQERGLYDNDLLSKAYEKALSQGLAWDNLNAQSLFRHFQQPFQMPSNVTLPPNSYAFFVSGAADGSVSFRRAEGTSWNAVSYGCQGCSFFVNEAGIGPESLGGAGILFKMDEKASQGEVSGELTLTCRARECWATQVSSWGPSASAAARFKFEAAKFDMPVSDFSQVLIIVTR